MLSKLTMSLAVAISLLLTDSALAQQKQDPKAQEAKNAEIAAEKASEEKRNADALAVTAAAEAAKAQESEGVLGYVKSKFTADYHGEYSFTRKDIDSANEADHDIQDLKIMHNPTITYRPVPNLKLIVTSEFKYTDAEVKETFINRYFRSLVLLTRENVLTEKDDGIRMDLGIARRIFDRNHGAAKSYGNSRLNASLSKKLSEKLSSTLLVQYLINDPVMGKIEPKTWKHSIELIPSLTFQITEKLSYFFNDDIVYTTPLNSNDHRNFDISHEMNIGVLSYQINDKNSTYLQLKYLHSSAESFAKDVNLQDWFEYYVGYTHTLTPKFSLTGEIGSTLFEARDGRDFFAKATKYPEVALFVDFAL